MDYWTVDYRDLGLRTIRYKVPSATRDHKEMGTEGTMSYRI